MGWEKMVVPPRPAVPTSAAPPWSVTPPPIDLPRPTPLEVHSSTPNCSSSGGPHPLVVPTLPVPPRNTPPAPYLTDEREKPRPDVVPVESQGEDGSERQRAAHSRHVVQVRL